MCKAPKALVASGRVSGAVQKAQWGVQGALCEGRLTWQSLALPASALPQRHQDTQRGLVVCQCLRVRLQEGVRPLWSA